MGLRVDPHVRKLGVWLPPQYDESKRRLPVLYDPVGFTGSGLAHANWKPFGDNVPERAARLIRAQKMGPAIIVFPDCFTALGGNQYVNSSSTAAGATSTTSTTAHASCPSALPRQASGIATRNSTTTIPTSTTGWTSACRFYIGR